MPHPDPEVLPDWPDGTVAILATAGGEPHAIPVSTAIRAGDRAVLFALSLRRESLARLREDPRCTLSVLAAGDVAVTAVGRATILEEPMAAAERVAAVRLEVERIQDHNQPRFEIIDGVRWRWTDPEAERQDAHTRAALRDLVARG